MSDRKQELHTYDGAGVPVTRWFAGSTAARLRATALQKLRRWPLRTSRSIAQQNTRHIAPASPGCRPFLGCAASARADDDGASLPSRIGTSLCRPWRSQSSVYHHRLLSPVFTVSTRDGSHARPGSVPTGMLTRVGTVRRGEVEQSDGLAPDGRESREQQQGRRAYTAAISSLQSKSRSGLSSSCFLVWAWGMGGTYA